MNNGMSGNQIGFNTPCIFRCEKAHITIGEMLVCPRLHLLQNVLI